MKKIILFLLLSLTISAQQRDSVLVDKKTYKVMYSETLQQPLWVKYRVTCVGGKFHRKSLDFYMEPGYITSDDADYTGNVWDKGHLAPAADFSCDKMELVSTFSYLNCALQHERLNRGLWRVLEMQEREWAKKEPLSITVRVLFKNPKKLTTGVSIPYGFYKIIYFEHSKKVRKFYFDNMSPSLYTTIWDYEID